MYRKYNAISDQCAIEICSPLHCHLDCRSTSLESNREGGNEIIIDTKTTVEVVGSSPTLVRLSVIIFFLTAAQTYSERSMFIYKC